MRFNARQRWSLGAENFLQRYRSPSTVHLVLFTLKRDKSMLQIRLFNKLCDYFIPTVPVQTFKNIQFKLIKHSLILYFC